MPNWTKCELITINSSSIETDPSPNPAAPFVNSLENSIREFCRPGMKLLAVTYSQSPEEQREVYRIIHEICQ